ncbi:MAG TPA: 2-phospho-L-lactate guanylyltransferase [Povalibacter sp.]|uniref:2-phospho-L-lactate guanylyltransferase n=1 Tax=Povalibacter sp. TaxID=1962978 RepID=UPI002B8E7E49|nr:2-phospho-L-lactate guanylyltransferase [Povalibacter sp.]HMN46879.1 2-phospho-L-lactate guanylyltransferase [Povalibacter sp.]
MADVSASQHGGTWALVPLKSSEQAKSRLASALDAQQRSRLFFAMAGHVIRTLRACDEIQGVAVATSSQQVAAFAAAAGALTVMQPADLGMSFALSSALDTLQSVKPSRVLMLPGDLPLATVASLQQLLAAPQPGIAIVPDRQRIGTNALLCSPPQIIAPTFGGRSFERHLHAATAAGMTANIVELPELALDVDEPEDLALLQQHPAATALQALSHSDPDFAPAR